MRTAQHGGPGPDPLHGQGRARRNPADEDVPEIGEEVAVSRALRDLADRLLATASGDISAVEHHEVHLQR
ncbi:dsRBD fold-containing protein [Thalassiella azotivora]